MIFFNSKCSITSARGCEFTVRTIGTVIIGLITLGNCTPVIATDELKRPARISEKSLNSIMLDVASMNGNTYAVGERGVLLFRPINGGWKQIPTPTSVSLTTVWVEPSGSIWALGHAGVALKSDGKELSWKPVLDGKKIAELVKENALANEKKGLPNATEQVREAERFISDGPSKPLFAINFFDRNNVIIAGSYGIVLKSSDGGVTWKSKTFDTNNSEGRHLYKIVKTSKNQVAYIVGESGYVAKTEDAGETYRKINTPYSGTYFSGISTMPGELLALGLRGNAYYTLNDGRNWEKCEIPEASTITAAIKSIEGRFILGDEAGRIFTSVEPCHGYKLAKIAQLPSITGMSEVIEGNTRNILISTAHGVKVVSKAALLGDR